MNKKNLIVLITLGLFSSVACGNQIYRFSPHEIYLGPELATVSVDTHIKNIHVKGRKHFSGLRLGYEFKKPASFYAGADLSLLTSFQYYSALQNERPIVSSHKSIGLDNFDLRFGYTAAPKSLFLTPFLGAGVYGLGTICHKKGFHEGWVYLSTGLRSDFSINPVFNLGLNLKLFKSVFSYKQFQNHNTNVSSYSYPWGAEIGIPFTWNFNVRGTWTFQIEPYWTKLDFTETQNLVGCKFLVGVHF